MSTTDEVLKGLVTVSALNTFIKSAKVKKKRIMKKKKTKQRR